MTPEQFVFYVTGMLVGKGYLSFDDVDELKRVLDTINITYQPYTSFINPQKQWTDPTGKYSQPTVSSVDDLEQWK